jgi:DNA-binding transcriptional ArsR family regulator
MPRITWDEGTAYDLFVSLFVLHRPTSFGLRPSWAAGVRSRLPAAQRDLLEKVQSFLPVPLSWLYLLPAEAKNAAGALDTLAQLPAAERLSSLLITADTSIEAINVLHSAALRQSWTSAEQEVLRAALTQRGIQARPGTIQNLCQAWSDISASGDKYLQALNTYYQVFFKEEETRLRDRLHSAREEAEDLARELPITELLEELSGGVIFEEVQSMTELVLVPSYWASPLVFYHRIRPETLLIAFSRRAAAHSLVPGDAVPGGLVEAMKAVADPTRMRILRYLSEGPLTPSQLARRLRLRPPTVIHHLTTLRLAGLIEVIIHAEGERGYTVHRDGMLRAMKQFGEFIKFPKG